MMVRGSLPLITATVTNAGLRQRPAAHPAHHRARATHLYRCQGPLADPDGGILADIAPTVLAMMGLAAPAAMSGRSLLLS